MPITDFLEKNARALGGEISLVEINPERTDGPHLGWQEFALVEPGHAAPFMYDWTHQTFEIWCNTHSMRRPTQ